MVGLSAPSPPAPVPSACSSTISEELSPPSHQTRREVRFLELQKVASSSGNKYVLSVFAGIGPPHPVLTSFPSRGEAAEQPDIIDSVCRVLQICPQLPQDEVGELVRVCLGQKASRKGCSLSLEFLFSLETTLKSLFLVHLCRAQENAAIPKTPLFFWLGERRRVFSRSCHKA